MVKSAASNRTKASAQARGHAAEDAALSHLQRAGLTLVERHYRVARGPSARSGEIDLVMRDRDGTLVFVEVRSRRSGGTAAASVDGTKQRKLIFAAQHYLQGLGRMPPCRFDVVAVDGDRLSWIQAAFDARL